MRSVEVLNHTGKETPEDVELEGLDEEIELLLSEEEPAEPDAPRDNEVVKIVDTRDRPLYADRQGGMDIVRLYLDEIGKIPLLSAEEEVELAKQIEAGLFAKDLLDPDSKDFKHHFKKLKYFRIEELKAAVKTGEEAKQRFIESNLRLAAAAARKRGGGEFMDRMAVATDGMMKAVEKFDYTKGYKFSTYGMWWIRQAMQRGAAKNRTIVLPAHRAEKLNTLNNMQRQLTNELEREPTPQELADAMDIPLSTVLYLMAISSPTVSIHASAGDDREVEDVISDRTVPPVETAALNPIYVAELRGQVEEVLEHLSETEQQVIKKRFGLGEFELTTQPQIAKDLGTSTDAVRRIERGLYAWLRHPANGHSLFGTLEDADEPSWQDEAACSDSGDKMFPGDKEKEAAAATEICRGLGCKAMKECLFAAIEQEISTNAVAGVRGGLTSEQRAPHIRRLRISRGLVKEPNKKRSKAKLAQK